MASILTKETYTGIYKDDYDAANGYHRILFNPGRPLQARELTQMQTIIQEEITRFGRNIFKDGAAVNPGGPTINKDYEFIKLDTSINELPQDYQTSIVGTEFTASSTVKFVVLEVVEAEGSDPDTLYVQYTYTKDAVAGENTIRVSAGEDMTNGTYTLTVQSTNTVTNPAVGKGVKFSSSVGDFFTQGRFVYSPEQSILLSKYSSNFTGVVGFKVKEDIVTVNDNINLYDNSGANLDFAAPGGDRYRITLTLAKQSDVLPDENFVFYANIVNSNIVEEAQGTADYNSIEDRLATRTYEESGNYIVNPFTLTFEEDSDKPTQLTMNISDGLAYVNGYRVEVPSDIKIDIDRAQTTIVENNEIVAATYGNYVLIDSDGAIEGTPDISNDVINLYDTASAGGSQIGTARARYFEEDGNDYKYYLYDINMTGFNQFRDVVSIGTSVSQYVNLKLEDNKAVLKEPTKRVALFKLPKTRPSTIGDVSLEVQRLRSGLSATGTTLPITVSGDETLVNLGDWVVIDETTGDIETGISLDYTDGSFQSVEITGLTTSGGTYSVFTKVVKSAGTARTKVLTDVTDTYTPEGNGDVILNFADIYKVTTIKETGVNGRDISYMYELDNGQRDAFYDIGSLKLRSGQTAPATVYVEFSYFSHTGGDFFNVNSYNGQVDYADIPSYRATDGKVYELRDVYDFRSVRSTVGTGMDVVNELPSTTGSIQGDVTYYLPRKDKVLLSSEGDVSVAYGIPSFDPKLPITPSNSIELFRLGFNPYTLDTEDVQTEVIKMRRYTMADIGHIDDKLEKLREVTSLSLLEVNTSTLSVIDANGLNRTKSGFFVDNFLDQKFSDTSSPDYTASIDPSEGLLRPSYTEDNVQLKYSNLSTGAVVKGDNVYIDYTEQSFINQPLISGYENINPFAVITNEGVFTLSPETDSWVDTTYAPSKIVNVTNTIGGTANALTVNTCNRTGWWGRLWWNNWRCTRRNWWGWNRWGWWGTNINTLTTTAANVRVVASETIREVIDDRVVDIAIIPFMRSIKVNFKIEGLRPNTQFFPFFDGVDVSDWVKQEAVGYFDNNHMDSNDYVIGSKSLTLTGHRGGATTLVSDSNGRIDGSFEIPNNDNIKFRTGTRNFKVLDISVDSEANALSMAKKDFISSGILSTRQQTIRQTRNITVRAERKDPLAQSFYVQPGDGAFITKVGVYFKSKSTTGVPVQMQIRTVENGIPTRTIVGNGIKFLSPDEVTAFDDLLLDETQENINANATYFEFDEPIYLMGDFEYAIVLLADSVEYNVYVAETEQFVIGSTERRITRQPAMGSLFKSQNGTTWTPSQKQDMAFEIYRAEFNTNATVKLENTNTVEESLYANPFEFTNGTSEVRVIHIDHGFQAGDTVAFNGLSDSDSDVYNGIAGSFLQGNQTITDVDPLGYKFTFDATGMDVNNIISGNGGGENITANRNINYDIVTPYIEMLNPESTSVGINGVFRTGKSFSELFVNNRWDATSEELVNKEATILNQKHMIGNESIETVEGSKSAIIDVTMSTNNSWVSPVIDLQRTSLSLVNNFVDNQPLPLDSDGLPASDGTVSPTVYENEPFEFVSEFEPVGGTSLAKHITVPVTLEDESEGLKIIFAANRPSAANIDLYYRIGGADVLLEEQSWNYAIPETNVPSDENPDVFREYSFLENNLTPFTQFQIKIVMKTYNSSKVPKIKDLRAISLVI